MKTAIVIPALNPESSIVYLVEQLQRIRDSVIIIVDDGSSYSYKDLFRKLEYTYDCVVYRHKENLGKGEALKTGIRAARNMYPEIAGIVTADADGQHLYEDIYLVSEAIQINPDSLVLGVRDFSSNDVPFKSYWGNRITSLVFRLSTKISCPDTQTGLRGIPAQLIDFCLSIPGSRYEYEMNMLTAAAKSGIPLLMLPIATVYINKNSASHFHPFKDSARIYFPFLKFGISSFLSAAADLSIFTLLTRSLFSRTTQGILAATITARCLSGVFNFGLNKKWCFKSRGDSFAQVSKYFILFCTQMLLSWAVVTLLSGLPLNLTLIKMIVDSMLFILSYFVQGKLIFREKPAETGNKSRMA